MEITTLQPFLNLYKLSKDLSLTLYLKFQILYIFTLRSMNMSTSQNLLMHIFIYWNFLGKQGVNQRDQKNYYISFKFNYGNEMDDFYRRTERVPATIQFQMEYKMVVICKFYQLLSFLFDLIVANFNLNNHCICFSDFSFTR